MQQSTVPTSTPIKPKVNKQPDIKSLFEATRHVGKPVQRVPLTIITGPKQARKSFHRPLTDFLTTLAGSSLVADVSLITSIPHKHTLRWILIVSNISDLQTIVTKIGGPDSLSRARMLVIIITVDPVQQAAIRTVVLRHVHNAAVLIPRLQTYSTETGDNDMAGMVKKHQQQQQLTHQRSLRVFAAVIKGWSVAHDEKEAVDSLRRACGDACILSHEDLVLPPGWDTENRVRASLEAVGESFEAMLQGVGKVIESKECLFEVQVEKKGKEKEEKQRLEKEKDARARAEREHFKVHVEEYNAWLDRLEQIGAATTRQGGQGQRDGTVPSTEVEDVDSAEAATENNASVPPQTDFFQRLLAGTGR